MNRARFPQIILIVVLALICPISLLGQAVNFAQIQGRVMDVTGANISGAKLQLTQGATGLVRATTSGTDGAYALPNLPVGTWDLRVSAPGFKEYIQKGILLTVGETPTIDVTMTVGAVSETVEVSADAAMVETHENSISTLIDNKRIMELPLDGRNAPQLIMLAGGAANPTLPSNDLNSTKNYGNGVGNGPSQTISVGGGQQNANNYLLDGGDNNHAFSNVNAPFPFPDAIQEFSVQSNGMSARYGFHAGATVNAVTRSGTNRFHGTAFEFLRNPIANAHNLVFANTLAPVDTMRRNQFGGTIGGPIVTNKLQFFTGYQGTRQSQSAPSTTVVVPTPAAINNGDFSSMMSAACQSSGTAKTLKSVNGVTITGNKVDPAKFNPQALAILQYVPPSSAASADPNGCGKISYTYPNVWNEDQGVVKLDWNMNNKQNLFGRYFLTDSRVPLAFDKTNILPQSQLSNQYARFQTATIGHNYQFSSNVVNALHLAATRMSINRGPANDLINPASVGINVPSPVPNGLVLSISSYWATGGGSSMPGYFVNNMYQIADDVDIVRGKHQLAFGVDFMSMWLNYLSTFQENGQFTFGGTYSGDNLVDFMLGFPSNFIQGNPEKENWKFKYLGLYAHDNYRLRSNLVLNYGIRWEPYFPAIDDMYRGSHFDASRFLANQRSSVYPNAVPGLQYCGDAGIPCNFANNQWKQFSPRVGIVWDPRNNGLMTLRASYGLFYDSPEMYYFDRYADNSPFGSGVSFAPLASSGGNLTNPYAGQGSIPQFPLPFPKPGDPNAYFPVNGVYINNDLNVRPMYVQNWNFSFETQMAPDWLLALSYIGSKSTHIWAGYEANPGMNVPVPASVSSTVPTCSSFTGTKAAPSTSNTNCRRALILANPATGQFVSNLTTLWDGANGHYNSMLATVKHRMTHNFTMMGNYTWSHCISDQDFTGELTNSRPTLYPSSVLSQDLNALKADHGDCGFDIRNSLNLSLVATTPKFEGWKGILLSNWQLAPLMTYRTGIALTVLTGKDTALLGSTTSFKDRPNQVGDPLSGACGNGVQVGTRDCWFNTGAYASPANGAFGNVGRNSMRGPSSFTLDTALSRRIPLAESKDLTLRFEAFNVLNHPVLGNPVLGMNSSNFGKIQSQSGNSRTLQIAAKFNF